MQPYQKAFIELAIAHQALRFGQFTLKSGRISPYFFNVGQLNSGQALTILGQCYASAILQSGLQYDILFGPAYKGIPLVCTTSIALHSSYELNVPYCFNRKEVKDHGEGGLIIGAPLKERRVLILDDVITKGTAIKEALELIHKQDAHIAGIVVALDRQEKGQGSLSAMDEFQMQFNLPIKAIVTFTDILHYLENHAQFSEYSKKLADYCDQYGALILRRDPL